MRPPHGRRGGRGGDARQPRARRAAGRGAAQRREGHPHGRRPAARLHRARRAVRGAARRARLGRDHGGDAAAPGLAARGGARPGRGALRQGRGGVRPGGGDHVVAGRRGGAGGAGGGLDARHGGGAGGVAHRVRLHQRRRGPAQRGAARGAEGKGRARVAGPPVRDEARGGGLRGGRPRADHRHRQAARAAQRQRGDHQGDRRRDGHPLGAARQRARGGVVNGGVRGLPARLRGDDPQGPGEDPGPHLPAPHQALAGGGELRGADAPAGKRAGLRGPGDGGLRSPTRVADGARRDARGVGGVGHGG